jgi:gamma-glutamylaminecyclotransferase
MPTLVFVFGTLKQGFPNAATNRGARWPGNFRTEAAFPLYLVGERHVPWLLNAPGTGLPVIGEVYAVDEATLRDMDALERVGHPDGYVRQGITVVPAGAEPGTPFARAGLPEARQHPGAAGHPPGPAGGIHAGARRLVPPPGAVTDYRPAPAASGPRQGGSGAKIRKK